jgi:hypothetical protein
MCKIFDDDDQQREGVQRGIFPSRPDAPGICPGIVRILQRCEKKNNSKMDVVHKGGGNLYRTIRLNHILIKELNMFPMNRPVKHRENGQILVLFVFALTVLLGFTALAIDGGMMYADRRYSQSVADNAALAGAGVASQYMEAHGIRSNNFTCASGSIVDDAIDAGYAAALARAVANQVTGLDNNISDSHGVEVICNEIDDFVEYRALVTTDVTTSFMHLFYTGPVRNTVTARVRVHPRSNQMAGNAIVSLSNDCSTGNNGDGINFVGGAGIIVQQGGIFSNSCIRGTGNSSASAPNGGIHYVTDVIGGQHFTPLDAGPTANKLVIDVPYPAACDGSGYGNASGSALSPGKYNGISTQPKDTLTLAPGLYCVKGDFDMKGTVTGDRVTIVLVNGASKINAQAVVKLSAPADASQVVGSAIPGVLFYMKKTNASGIDLLGGATSRYAGLVYAPDGQIEVGGGADVSTNFTVQLVANYVRVHGGGGINITYYDSPVLLTLPKLDFVE